MAHSGIRLEAVAADPLEKWMNKLGPEARLNCRSTWNTWTNWLHKQPGYETATPESLPEFQESSKGRDRFRILDLIEDHCQARGGTYGSMIVRVSRLRN